jgi:hypothetical protein
LLLTIPRCPINGTIHVNLGVAIAICDWNGMAWIGIEWNRMGVGEEGEGPVAKVE